MAAPFSSFSPHAVFASTLTSGHRSQAWPGGCLQPSGRPGFAAAGITFTMSTHLPGFGLAKQSLAATTKKQAVRACAHPEPLHRYLPCHAPPCVCRIGSEHSTNAWATADPIFDSRQFQVNPLKLRSEPRRLVRPRDFDCLLVGVHRVRLVPCRAALLPQIARDRPLPTSHSFFNASRSTLSATADPHARASVGGAHMRRTPNAPPANSPRARRLTASATA